VKHGMRCIHNSFISYIRYGYNKLSMALYIDITIITFNSFTETEQAPWPSYPSTPLITPAMPQQLYT
jgi:hypothetical protein